MLLLCRRRLPHPAVHADQRDDVVGATHHLAAAQALHTVRIEPGDLFDGGDRNGKLALAYGDHQRWQNRQRQRQANQKCRPRPDLGTDLHTAVELDNLRAHGIHAHTTAGDLRHRVAGREAGPENQIQAFLGIQPRGGFAVDHALLDGLGAND